MSVQNNLPRAEMEMNPLLRKTIVVNHILQVVFSVVLIIICGALLQIFLMLILLLGLFPIILCIILWTASKCNFQDLHLILIHFNPILSTLWFLAVFPVFVLCCIFKGFFIIGAIFIGFMSFSSAIFAVYGIWRSARNVVLSARSAEHEHFSRLPHIPSTHETGVTFTNLNGITLPQATYGQPMSTP